MIDYRHLRAGNYILVEAAPDLPRPHKVMAKDIYDIATGKVTLAAIEGIKLTSDLLAKCGFRQAESTDWGKIYIFTLDRFMIAFGNTDVSSNWDHYYFPYKGHGYNNEAMIKYLHQLQNLYFALTGEELPVNL